MAKKEMEETKEGLGISGFTIGIVSLVLAGSLGIFLSVIGFIFCAIQQKRYPTKLGRAGKIINAISFVLSVLLLFLLAPILKNSLGI